MGGVVHIELYIYIALAFIVILNVRLLIRFIFHRVWFYIHLAIHLVTDKNSLFILIPFYYRRRFGADWILIRGNAVYPVKVIGIYRKLSDLVIDNQGNWFTYKYSGFHSQFGDGTPNHYKLRPRTKVLDAVSFLDTTWPGEAKCQAVAALIPPPMRICFLENRKMDGKFDNITIHGILFVKASGFFKLLKKMELPPDARKLTRELADQIRRKIAVDRQKGRQS